MNLHQETRYVLKKYGIRPTKKLSQNFLIDESILKEQVDYASIKDKDRVLEVGAGIGNLTKLLLEKAKKVYVVEKDKRMIEILEDRFSDKENLKIISGDALKVGFPNFNKIVSNIPYAISSPLTFRFLKMRFNNGVVMYQKEFASRMIAKPGTKDYSRLSVGCYYFANVRLLCSVPKNAFYPEPEVKSALVEITPKDPPFEVDVPFFFKLTKGLFIHKKKTVKNSFNHSFDMIFEKGALTKVDAVGALPKEILSRRVFSLTPDEIAEMSVILGGIG